jgi:hypothetical protein
MNEWFVTWNVPGYQEWAKKNGENYLLVIIRKEENGFLCAKANLIMNKERLPGFETLEEIRFSTEGEANEKIEEWKLIS